MSMTTAQEQNLNSRNLEELAGHIAEIFRSEDKNRGNIRLYKVGGYWMAFEKSAYFIRNILGDKDLLFLRCEAVPFPIVGTVIPEAELTRLYSTLDLSEVSGNFRSFTMDCPLTRYAAWHRSAVKRFSGDI